MIARLFRPLLILLCCWIIPTQAANLSDISVSNSVQQSTIKLQFTGKPSYSWFVLHNPERFVLDLQQNGVIKGLPLRFSGQNLLKQIRTSRAPDKRTIRLVFELTADPKANVVAQPQAGGWQLLITLNRRTAPTSAAVATAPASTPLVDKPAPKVSNSNTTTYPGGNVVRNQQIIVAIDAGHGGQDPGAIGQHGLREKNVTIAIARKLQTLLNKDPMFKAVLTRKGDYFISVMGRSEVARKENANLLISIHADSAPARTATGASVWVLSNRRANSELASWLEQTEKQSELLGGAGDLLANSKADPYLSQAVLDLQFGHSQRVGYDVATKVLQQLRLVTSLHKRLPEHASLGVLRSPDIPSLLVETGFISNRKEEKLLGSAAHQNRIAQAIYQGLRAYFRTHPQDISQPEHHSELSTAQSTAIIRHKVQRGETLSQLANHYGVTVASLVKLNQLKKTSVWSGQSLKIPVVDSHAQATKRGFIRHRVAAGETLTQLSRRYGVSVARIKQLNQLHSQNIMRGQTLLIPQQ